MRAIPTCFQFRRVSSGRAGAGNPRKVAARCFQDKSSAPALICWQPHAGVPRDSHRTTAASCELPGTNDGRRRLVWIHISRRFRQTLDRTTSPRPRSYFPCADGMLPEELQDDRTYAPREVSGHTIHGQNNNASAQQIPRAIVPPKHARLRSFMAVRVLGCDQHVWKTERFRVLRT